jgi:hypothetical protein
MSLSFTLLPASQYENRATTENKNVMMVHEKPVEWQKY